MPRSPRYQSPGAFYHIMLRGNQGRQIFYSDAQRSRFCLLTTAAVKEAIADEKWAQYEIRDILKDIWQNVRWGVERQEFKRAFLVEMREVAAIFLPFSWENDDIKQELRRMEMSLRRKGKRRSEESTPPIRRSKRIRAASRKRKPSPPPPRSSKRKR